MSDTQNKTKQIKRDLQKVWNTQKDFGFSRLYKAYRFFTDVRDDDGEMVYHPLCAETHEMRGGDAGDNGKTDFQRLICKKIDPSTRFYDDDIEQLANRIANEYFDDQASRLANFIVRIKNTEMTDENGAVLA